MKGLSFKEARRRLRKNGANVIFTGKRVSWVKILIEQFSSPLIIILVVSAIALGVVSGFSGDSNVVDIALIVAIVLISGFSGFFQDYKAERSIEAIKKMSAPKARVIRGGREVMINSEEVVEGDLLVIEEGEVVAADARVLKTNGARVDEAAISGESRAVAKKRGDLIFMNTYLVSGQIYAVVERTGMSTRMGKIAKKLGEIEEERSVFNQEISRLSKKLSKLVLAVAAITIVAGFFRYGLYSSILGGVALAVAAIPEGLSAVLILSLASGARVMVKKRALVRKLSVVESMGSVNVICTDKTGTLTRNEMRVTSVFVDNKEFDAGEVNSSELIDASALNNNVRRLDGGKLVGDETDLAVYKFAEEKGVLREEREKSLKRIFEIAFSSKRAMMSVVVEGRGLRRVYSKGAPEVLLEKCEKLLVNGRIRRLRKKDREVIL